MFCGQCGNRNEEEARFCAACGAPTQASDDSLSSSQPATPRQSTPIDPRHLRLAVWSFIGLLILAGLATAAGFAIQKYKAVRAVEMEADNETFGIAVSAGTVGALQAYIDTCEKSCGHLQEARTRIDDLNYSSAKSAPNDEGLKNYLNNCDDSCQHKKDAEAELDNRAYAAALDENTEASFRQYMDSCKLCQHKQQAEQMVVLAKAEAERKAKLMLQIENVKGIGSVRRAVLVPDGYAGNCLSVLKAELGEAGITIVPEGEEYHAHINATISTPVHWRNSWASGYKARYSVVVKRVGDEKVLLSRSGSELGTSARDNCDDAAEQIADEIKDAKGM